MQITNTQEAGTAVLGVAGSLDATSVADFDVAWKLALDEGAEKLVVDLKGVDYISSAGLRGILLLAKPPKPNRCAWALRDSPAWWPTCSSFRAFFRSLRSFPM